MNRYEQDSDDSIDSLEAHADGVGRNGENDQDSLSTAGPEAMEDNWAGPDVNQNELEYDLLQEKDGRVEWIDDFHFPQDSTSLAVHGRKKFWRNALWSCLLILNEGSNYFLVYLGIDTPQNTPEDFCEKLRFVFCLVREDGDIIRRPDDPKIVEYIFEHRQSPGRDDRGPNELFKVSELPLRQVARNRVGLRVKVFVEAIFQPAFVPLRYDSKRMTGMVGLDNLGATCYLNSLLQMLYHINSFRKSVYLLPHQEEDALTSSITLSLQNVFYQLQTASQEVNTRDLLSAFGWSSAQAFMQQDIQEMMRVLLDKLEEKMKSTQVDGTIQKLFCGKSVSYIQCIHTPYKSTREEPFYDIQLDVKGCKDIYSSFEKYIHVEKLCDDNQYDAGKEHGGKQDAYKGVYFSQFPPVLTIHLKRFDFDLKTMNFQKIHDHYEFPIWLDLENFSNPPDNIVLADSNTNSTESASATAQSTTTAADTTRVKNQYVLHSVLVHQGDVGGGHYYAYIRPSNDTNRDHVYNAKESITVSEVEQEWYKFNDETVLKVQSREAVQSCYGRAKKIQFIDASDPLPASLPDNLRSMSSAYMLVYIRATESPQIMASLPVEDIPITLRNHLHQEYFKKKQLEKIAIQAKETTTINYVTEREVRAFTQYSRTHDWIHEKQFLKLSAYKTTTRLGILLEICSRLQKLPIFVELWKLSKPEKCSYRVVEDVASHELHATVNDSKGYYVEEKDIAIGFHPNTQAISMFEDVYHRILAEEAAWKEQLQQAVLPHKEDLIFYNENGKTIQEGCGIGKANVLVEELRKFSSNEAQELLVDIHRLEQEMIDSLESYKLQVTFGNTEETVGRTMNMHTTPNKLIPNKEAPAMKATFLEDLNNEEENNDDDDEAIRSTFFPKPNLSPMEKFQHLQKTQADAHMQPISTAGRGGGDSPPGLFFFKLFDPINMIDIPNIPLYTFPKEQAVENTMQVSETVDETTTTLPPPPPAMNTNEDTPSSSHPTIPFDALDSTQFYPYIKQPPSYVPMKYLGSMRIDLNTPMAHLGQYVEELLLHAEATLHFPWATKQFIYYEYVSPLCVKRFSEDDIAVQTMGGLFHDYGGMIIVTLRSIYFQQYEEHHPKSIQDLYAHPTFLHDKKYPFYHEPAPWVSFQANKRDVIVLPYDSQYECRILHQIQRSMQLSMIQGKINYYQEEIDQLQTEFETLLTSPVKRNTGMQNCFDNAIDLTSDGSPPATPTLSTATLAATTLSTAEHTTRKRTYSDTNTTSSPKKSRACMTAEELLEDQLDMIASKTRIAHTYETTIHWKQDDIKQIIARIAIRLHIEISHVIIFIVPLVVEDQDEYDHFHEANNPSTGYIPAFPQSFDQVKYAVPYHYLDNDCNLADYFDKPEQFSQPVNYSTKILIYYRIVPCAIDPAIPQVITERKLKDTSLDRLEHAIRGESNMDATDTTTVKEEEELVQTTINPTQRFLQFHIQDPGLRFWRRQFCITLAHREYQLLLKSLQQLKQKIIEYVEQAKCLATYQQEQAVKDEEELPDILITAVSTAFAESNHKRRKSASGHPITTTNTGISRRNHSLPDTGLVRSTSLSSMLTNTNTTTASDHPSSSSNTITSLTYEGITISSLLVNYNERRLDKYLQNIYWNRFEYHKIHFLFDLDLTADEILSMILQKHIGIPLNFAKLFPNLPSNTVFAQCPGFRECKIDEDVLTEWNDDRHGNIVSQEVGIKRVEIENEYGMQRTEEQFLPTVPCMIGFIRVNQITEILFHETVTENMILAWGNAYKALDDIRAHYCIQMINPYDILWFRNEYPGKKSMIISVFHYTIEKNIVKACPPQYFTGPCISYVTCDDTYQSLFHRIATQLGEKDESSLDATTRLAIVQNMKSPVFLPKQDTHTITAETAATAAVGGTVRGALIWKYFEDLYPNYAEFSLSEVRCADAQRLEEQPKGSRSIMRFPSVGIQRSNRALQQVMEQEKESRYRLEGTALSEHISTTSTSMMNSNMNSGNTSTASRAKRSGFNGIRIV